MHHFNLYRTPAALRRQPVPVPVHLMAAAPSCRPAPATAFSQPLTEEEMEAVFAGWADRFTGR